MPTLSIILPFHNEAEGVRNLFQRLYPVLGGLGLTYEIICIDDGSQDKTYGALCHEREMDQRVKIIKMARNFGKEAALTCGLDVASGDAAITMDSDLQHPPEVITDLVAKWREGVDLVYAIRSNRKTDSYLRRLLSRAFYAVFKAIADIQMPEGAGDYCLLDRKVINAIKQLPERNRFMKGLVAWVGFTRGMVNFDVQPRQGGTSHWNLFRLVRFAFDGLTAFSTFPLRIWTWCGALISILTFSYGIYLTVRTLISGVDVPGYASLMVGMLFLGGVQLLSLGILGEYMGRIFSEVKRRPLYLISEQSGFNKE
ncbi:MAG: glycosyltransferase family 2 protein [Alphaproteobacteria bacterium]|nr:glycosyltransferase family 2 protein [Alphaproteobacteria bacterium]MBV8547955.1 glycosyltransferase family 2 protein [Alphaproteobacteria bacterium]